MMRQFYTAALAMVAITASTAAMAQMSPPFPPINDLGSGLYLGQFQGGLYPGGSNTMPSTHFAEGLARTQDIQPLDIDGNPNPDGKYVLLSVGMSNTAGEFCSRNPDGVCDAESFMGQAAADPDVDHTNLVILNGARGGQGAQRWDSPDKDNYNRIRDDILIPRGLSEAQVQAVWLKQANLSSPANPSLPSDEADAYEFLTNLGEITRALAVRYPNLQQVFVSSRIYAGYGSPTSNNPEPYAYESGFSVKWLIESQIEQVGSGVVDPHAGDLGYDTVAPWLAWGPYMWADGTVPRSDGLVWPRQDFQSDGIHPSTSGQQKVGEMLLEFFKTSPHTQPWFLEAIPGDFDGDGDVDGGDFLAWQRGESPNSLSPGDLSDWKNNFAAPPLVAGGLTGVGGMQAVPEPSGLLLLLSGAVALATRRLASQQRGQVPRRADWQEDAKNSVLFAFVLRLRAFA